MKTKKTSPNLFFYIGLIAFGFGIAALSIPDFSMKTMVIIIGALIAAGGLGILIYQLRKKSENSFINISQIVLSLLNIAFGIVLISIPSKFETALIILLGVLLAMSGILSLIVTLKIKPLSNFGKMFIAIALIMLIAGVIFILNPFNAEDITIFFGIIFSVYGLSNIMMSFWLRSEYSKKLQPNEEKIEIEIKVIDTEADEANKTEETKETNETNKTEDAKQKNEEI
ncbi:MAG TPA: DUF308 domain-containing protein [Bacteroidales bacterium]|nr:DUF308 domain-containing protein [Bacteroidales bacterium]HOR59886.1 DUF308 domain-containing protein [Bacteroidales bacterium]HPL03555.1 DUF308 domain-containing protein [Bacteroidales bacterium]